MVRPQVHRASERGFRGVRMAHGALQHAQQKVAIGRIRDMFHVISAGQNGLVEVALVTLQPYRVEDVSGAGTRFNWRRYPGSHAAGRPAWRLRGHATMSALLAAAACPGHVGARVRVGTRHGRGKRKCPQRSIRLEPMFPRDRRLGMSDDKHAVVYQEPTQRGHHAVPRVGVQVDQEVAAEDDIVGRRVVESALGWV